MKKLLLSLLLAALIMSPAFSEDLPDVAFVKQANALYKEGRLDESITLYRKAIGANPYNFFAYMNCGYAYAAKGDNKTALLYLEKAYSLRQEEELKKNIEMLKRLENKEYFKTDSPLKLNKKIGLNFSAIYWSAGSYGVKTGLNTGLEAVYGFGGLLSAQAGIFYTQKGGKAAGSNDSYVNLDYIEVPAAVKISILPLKELLVGAYFGGSAAVRIAAKSRVGSSESELSGSYEVFDLALLGGLEATYPVLGLFWINADLRFSQGMIDVYKDIDSLQTNPVFTASIGIVF